MKSLSITNLQTVAAGSNWAWAHPTVAGYTLSVPYPTAKATKKFLEKTEGFVATVAYAVSSSLNRVGVQRPQDVLGHLTYSGVALLSHMALEDSVDHIYASLGLDAGKDK
jgi:hypothetical protein